MSLSNNIRALRPASLRSISGLATRSFTTTVSQKRSRDGYLDDSLFSMASSLMRSLEKEFDYARRRMVKNLGYFPLPTESMLPTLISPSSRAIARDLITTDDQGNRKFQLPLDLSGFEPEEIKIKTRGHTLDVKAKKEKQTDGSYFLREISHSFQLPKEINVDDLKTKWDDYGTLLIEAQLPKKLESKQGDQKHKEIKIDHEKESLKLGDTTTSAADTPATKVHS